MQSTFRVLYVVQKHGYRLTHLLLDFLHFDSPRSPLLHYSNTLLLDNFSPVWTLRILLLLILCSPVTPHDWNPSSSSFQVFHNLTGLLSRDKTSVLCDLEIKDQSTISRRTQDLFQASSSTRQCLYTETH